MAKSGSVGFRKEQELRTASLTLADHITVRFGKEELKHYFWYM